MQKKTNISLENLKNIKLSIQFSLDGFSFCISETASGNTIHFCNYTFDAKDTSPENLLKEIETIFKKNEHLQHEFSSVVAIHQNNLATLVPKKFFDETKLNEYLNFTIKVLETDFVTFDDIEAINSKNVYIPYVNINNFLFQNFGEFEYKHHLTILIEKLINRNTNRAKKMFVNVSKSTFDIIVLDHKKLLLSNTFSYHTKEDFIYYILFVAEQLKMDPKKFQLSFIGNINTTSENYKLTSKYIYDIDFLESNNSIFDTLKYPKHSNYTLLG